MQKQDDRLKGWFQAMVEGAKEYAIFSLDSNAIIATWNPGAERILGFTEAEAVGESGALIFTPEDLAEGAYEAELRIAATEGRAKDDRWHARRDGTRFWASGLLMSLRDSDGIVYGFVKIVQDRTSEKRVEESLRASEEQFARLFLGNPAAMLLERRDNNTFSLANEAFFELTGYWRSDALGRTGEALGLWAEPAQRTAILRALDDAGSVLGTSITLRAKSGELIPCLASFKFTHIADTEALVSTYIPQPATG